MAEPTTSRLARFLAPWTRKGSVSPNGNGHEEKSLANIDFIGDAASGRVVYVGSSVPGDVEEVRRSTAYAAAAYVYTAIRYRAENVAEPPLTVVEKTEDGDELVEQHPIYDLFDEPSPDYDMGELIELTQTYWDLGGDALWVKDANLAGGLGRLTPFQSLEYDVNTQGDRILGRFDVKLRDGARRYGPEDVVYFRYPNPGSRHRGLSPTDVALHWLNLGKRTTATIKSLLKNAMFPSVVISTHPEWSPDDDEFQRFKDLIDQFHAGPQNAGKPFVTMGGGKASRVAFTLQELVPEQLLDRVEAVVSSVFRIPPIVLGHLVGLKNSPWSQMEQAHRQAYSDAIQPLWRRHEKALTRQLLRPIDADRMRRVAYDTSGIGALQEDESQKIEDAARATWWTVNQRLIHSGQPPLPEDDPRGEYIELVDAPRSPVLPLDDGDPPDPDTDDELDDGENADSYPLAQKGSGPARRWVWARFDLMAKAQEPEWVSGVDRELKADRDAILTATRTDLFESEWERVLEAQEKQTPGESLAAMLAAVLEEDRWHNRVGPLIASTSKTAVQDLAGTIGLDFALLQAGLEEYTAAEAAWLVTNVSNTTKRTIAQELAAGIARGESVSMLRDRLMGSPGFSKVRSELIARTETTRVTNGSQRASLAEYAATTPDEVVEKAWLVTKDGRQRDEHDALDQRGAEEGWLGINDLFRNGLDAPGEPNCRCTLLYRIREA